MALLMKNTIKKQRYICNTISDIGEAYGGERGGTYFINE
ncbi:Hypothetical protein ETEE_0712 [Edwardsiella anguillarum ET080813]|uniref:Uncharacterized protein n=1 Tax=Edwardsiella anguillarum ET080813 TaxID=667120 RepID=A0A076LKG2_9GAMM|nr:Hypothetical protein ETEE_0712 [Edwardsiella anguillarum ET080813]